MFAHIVPKQFFLTAGIGFANDKIVSFEYALRECGCERFNLVPVSSIMAPNCNLIDSKQGISTLNTGEIVYCVMCRKSSCIEIDGKTPITTNVLGIKDKDMWLLWHSHSLKTETRMSESAIERAREQSHASPEPKPANTATRHALNLGTSSITDYPRPIC